MMTSSQVVEVMTSSIQTRCASLFTFIFVLSSLHPPAPQHIKKRERERKRQAQNAKEAANDMNNCMLLSKTIRFRNYDRTPAAAVPVPVVVLAREMRSGP
jgi:hypothetical protein